jgi:DNA-binding CsgD family transcriptional regulator/tetratricopeptide (TPR) repeat protein
VKRPPRTSGSRGGSDGLIGRRIELEAFERLLADVSAGGSGALALLGEPGIGKTRLLGELRARAQSAGLLVLSGRGTELELEDPFSLVVDALDESLGARDPATLGLGDERLAELGKVLPSLAGAGGVLASSLQVERYRLHHAVRHALSQLASERGLLLALDDVHWADPASLELISSLLPSLPSGSLMVLAFRPHQVPRQLASVLERAEREGAVRTLELPPLSLEEAGELLGAAVDRSRLADLYTESGGNPFYLEQLARASAGGAARSLPAGATAPPETAELPPAIRVAIAQELAALSRPALQLAEAAAVAGEPCELDLAVRVAELDERVAVAAMDELVAAGLLRAVDPPGWFAFRHPILRRAVYDAAGPGARLMAHRRTADALAERRAPVATRAHHLERSAAVGDEEAVALLTEAGRAAVARAPAAAARWFDAALRLLPDGTERERRLSLSLSLAEALGSTGRVHQSRAVLAGALELSPRQMHGQLTSALARADQALGRQDEARRRLDSALSQTEPNSADAAGLRAALALNHLMAGEWGQAVAASREAYSLARELGDRDAVLIATGTNAFVAQYQGALAEAQVRLDEAADGVDELDDDELTVPLLETLATIAEAEVSVERWVQAERHSERGLRLCRARGHGHLFVELMASLCAALLMQGRLAEARQAGDQAAEGARMLANEQALTIALGLQGWTATFQGDLMAALAMTGEALQAASRAPGAMYSWYAAVAHGEALVEAGELERGREVMYSAGGPELSDLPPISRSSFHRVLVELELAAGRMEAAEAATRLTEAGAFELRFHAGHARHARARMLLAGGDHAAAAAVALEAVEHFEASSTRVLTGRARLLAGQALAATGRAAEAEREARLAHAGFVACGARRDADRAARELRRLGVRVSRRSTRRRAPAEGPGALTAREREVAVLVGEGRTNRQIAAQLHLSEKTVEAHLARTFAKLGVTSRTGVAVAISRSADQFVV